MIKKNLLNSKYIKIILIYNKFNILYFIIKVRRLKSD